MIDSGFKPIGKDFPVFLHPKTKEEYALARTEKKVGIGHKGFTFYASPEVTLEQDLERRDIRQMLTQGLGAGSRPDTGKQAAIDDKEKIVEAIDGADMLFI